MAKLILDTGVLVGAVRGQIDLATLPDEDDLALPAVVLAEYLAGVIGEDDHGRRAVQRAFLDEVLGAVPVEDYDPIVARHHAELLVHTQRVGQPRGAHDLIVAATARATGRTLITTDERVRFDELPGVSARVIPRSERPKRCPG
jgi:tRNA(fMet)-specific endonuclease VapC